MEVQREVVLEAPVEEVWDALTEPERLEEWFANDVELELEPGGEEPSAGTTARSARGRRGGRSGAPFRLHLGREPRRDRARRGRGGTRVLVTETVGAGWEHRVSPRGPRFAHA